MVSVAFCALGALELGGATCDQGVLEQIQKLLGNLIPAATLGELANKSEEAFSVLHLEASSQTQLSQVF